MPESYLCPLCAITRKWSEMVQYSHGSKLPDGYYCCPSCGVLMTIQEIEERLAEVSAHMLNTARIMDTLRKYAK